MSKGAFGIIGLVLAAIAATAGRNNTTNTGYTPLVDTPPAGGGGTDIFKPYPVPDAPTPYNPDQGFKDFSDKLKVNPLPASPAGGLTGLTIKTLDASPSAPATSTPAGITIGTISSPAVKPPAGTGTWTWRTPSGTVESREPTQEEKDSGLGCPEVPDIWTYPGQSAMAVRYCQNTECPSNKTWTDVSGAVLAPTPAILEQQKDSQGNISYYCRVCRQVTS